jgi:hypothetical protein
MILQGSRKGLYTQASGGCIQRSHHTGEELRLSGTAHSFRNENDLGRKKLLTGFRSLRPSHDKRGVRKQSREPLIVHHHG